MANIYSSSFFHYTSENGLIEILKNGFKASYCKEQFKDSNGDIKYIGIPMISFCDIPLSLISEVLYGGYAIGMKREWGIKKALVPVFYFSNNSESMITKGICSSCDTFYTETDPRQKKKFGYKMLGMSKPIQKYNDNAYAEEKNKDNYREREWRKVYYKKEWFTSAEYTQWRGEKGSPKKMLSEGLSFCIKDIEFIIIDNNKCIDMFIKKIMEENFLLCGKSIEIGDKYKLISKIITKDQIKENF